jgi:hypothetical protein
MDAPFRAFLGISAPVIDGTTGMALIGLGVSVATEGR